MFVKGIVKGPEKLATVKIIGLAEEGSVCHR